MILLKYPSLFLPAQIEDILFRVISGCHERSPFIIDRPQFLIQLSKGFGFYVLWHTIVGLSNSAGNCSNGINDCSQHLFFPYLIRLRLCRAFTSTLGIIIAPPGFCLCHFATESNHNRSHLDRITASGGHPPN